MTVDVTIRPVVIRIGPGVPQPVVIGNTTVQKIRDGQQRRGVVVQKHDTPVRVESTKVQQLTSIQRGPPGKDGDNLLERPAAATVSALRLISESTAGVVHLDPHDDGSVAGMLGVSITAGGIGSEIKIRPGGTIDDAGWSWSPGFVFAGPDGTLTQSPPVAGWEIVVGHAPSATRLNLTFDEPVKLA